MLATPDPRTPSTVRPTRTGTRAVSPAGRRTPLRISPVPMPSDEGLGSNVSIVQDGSPPPSLPVSSMSAPVPVPPLPPFAQKEKELLPPSPSKLHHPNNHSGVHMNGTPSAMLSAPNSITTPTPSTPLPAPTPSPIPLPTLKPLDYTSLLLSTDSLNTQLASTVDDLSTWLGAIEAGLAGILTSSLTFEVGEESNDGVEENGRVRRIDEEEEEEDDSVLHQKGNNSFVASHSHSLSMSQLSDDDANGLNGAYAYGGAETEGDGMILSDTSDDRESYHDGEGGFGAWEEDRTETISAI